MKKALLVVALLGGAMYVNAQDMTPDKSTQLITSVDQISISSLATDEGSVEGLLDRDYENDIQDDINFVCVNNVSADDQYIEVTLPASYQNVQVELRERWAAKWLNPGWTYDWAPRATEFQVLDGTDYVTLVAKDENFNTEFHKDGTFVTIDLKHTNSFNKVRLLFLANPNKNIVQLGELQMYPLKGATGINKVEAAAAENGVAYNLAGQKVANGYKGIVVVNGKKVVK